MAACQAPLATLVRAVAEAMAVMAAVARLGVAVEAEVHVGRRAGRVAHQTLPVLELLEIAQCEISIWKF
tara:strand:+ start:206 stop:412 length:207 start_codon:yes stop_codon:yes gene_type:complete